MNGSIALTAGAIPTLEQLSCEAERLAAKRRELVAAATDMEREVLAVRKRHMPRLRKIAIDVKAMLDALEGLVGCAASLFAKPKSRTVADIQFGWRKGRGSIQFDDEAKVIARIKAQRPDLIEMLITTKETVVKDALGNLGADVLRKLGISVVEAGDKPFVKPKDGDTDKLIALALGEEQ
jgi:phage host-nuclease inhibitor protein Gam